nr:hypothetical protein [Tanacetum cinerariifolium]
MMMTIGIKRLLSVVEVTAAGYAKVNAANKYGYYCWKELHAPKCDLRLIDEHFESVYVDVISNIAPSDVKIVESKHKTVDVNHKGVFSTEEPKPIMKNNFSPPIIEDWHSDDESETKTAQAKEIADLKKRVKKLERKRRSKTLRINLFKIDYELAARLRAEEQKRKPLTKA